MATPWRWRRRAPARTSSSSRRRAPSAPATSDRRRPGGLIAAYVPTAIQLQRFVLEAHQTRAFLPAESMETIERWWRVTRESLRPNQKMIGHTGFLAFARRIADAFVDCVD